MLRINLDGTDPVRQPIRRGTGPSRDSIWAYGLRNPFRAYPNAPNGQPLVGDVGGNHYSTAKLNVAIMAPTTAGPTPRASAPAPCTSPLFSYPHTGHDAVITGGSSTTERSTRPLPGSYFFADYAQNWIRRLTFDAAGTSPGPQLRAG